MCYLYNNLTTIGIYQQILVKVSDINIKHINSSNWSQTERRNWYETHKRRPFNFFLRNVW
jgi:hypothetical protein